MERKVYADVSENKGITDNDDVNLDSVWEDEDDLSEDANLEIADFTPNNDSLVRAAVKFINLVTGKSALSAILLLIMEFYQKQEQDTQKLLIYKVMIGQRFIKNLCFFFFSMKEEGY